MQKLVRGMWLLRALAAGLMLRLMKPASFYLRVCLLVRTPAGFKEGGRSMYKLACEALSVSCAAHNLA